MMLTLMVSQMGDSTKKFLLLNESKVPYELRGMELPLQLYEEKLL